MTHDETGAERYFADRLRDPKYAEAYRLEQMRQVMTRLVERLRVHASGRGTGYVNDPQSAADMDFPGESERWCASDQYAVADAEILLGMERSIPSLPGREVS